MWQFINGRPYRTSGSSWTHLSPSALAVTITGDTEVTLSWTNTLPANYNSVVVYQSLDGITYFQKTTSIAGSTSKAITVVAGEIYYYKIRYKKGNYYSDYSDVISVDYEDWFNFAKSDGKVIGWYDPETAGARQEVAGVESIYWDMMYGSAQRGPELNSGNIVKYSVYEITATQANFFYTGCVIGDVFVCGTVKTLDANNKVKLVLGNHLTQPVATNRPTNGVFDGTDNFMKTAPIAWNQPGMVYALWKQISWAANQYVWDGGGAGDTMDLVQKTATPKYGIYAGSWSSDVTGSAIGTYEILRALYNGANSSIQSDNNTLWENKLLWSGDAGSAAPGGFTLGNASPAVAGFANFGIREIILRNNADSLDRQKNIMNHWRTKWSINPPTNLLNSNQHNMVEYNGDLYISLNTAKRRFYKYIVSTGEWVHLANLPFPEADRQSSVMNVVGDKIYFIGGMTSATSTMRGSCYEYDIATDVWTEKTAKPTAVEDFGSAVYGGKIYCFGGLKQGAVPTNLMEVYDPVANTWDETKADLPVNKWSGNFGCICNGKIYAISSCAAYVGYPILTTVKTVYEYDPVGDAWSTKTEIPIGLAYKSLSVIGNKIYVFGGQGDGDYTNGATRVISSYYYNTEDNTWTQIADAPYAALGYTTAALNGKVYMHGGIDILGASRSIVTEITV